MLDLPPGSTLPSVEDLVLTNFSFSADQAASWTRLLEAGTRLRRLALDGTILDICQFIHQLSSSGVPGGLRSFSLRVQDTSPRLTDSAAGIHDTSPRIPPQLSEAVTSLLHRTTNLTEFLAYDLPKHILHIVVSSHGGNIRRLTFRRTNFTGLQLGGPIHPPTGVTLLRESSAYKGSLFSPDELQDFARRLPLLERLGIDLCFAGDLHLDILHAIATFPSLKFVELNMPHPTSIPTVGADPPPTSGSTALLPRRHSGILRTGKTICAIEQQQMVWIIDPGRG
ncbi:hypothetical protein BJX68DRAFT_264108 [Aspergillus pseudodeflectus]|uniref:Uncharacterized protein n=1 Tax=Aspergillus pseudodeflectus TaxID=176178 RepID=A0ABR4KTZ6_9EURO